MALDREVGLRKGVNCENCWMFSFRLGSKMLKLGVRILKLCWKEWMH